MNIQFRYIGKIGGLGEHDVYTTDRQALIDCIDRECSFVVSPLPKLKNNNPDLTILSVDFCHLNDVMMFADVYDDMDLVKYLIEKVAQDVHDACAKSSNYHILFYGNPTHPSMSDLGDKRAPFSQTRFNKLSYTLPTNVTVGFASGCALNYDSIDRNFVWNPQGGICYMMGKPKRSRIELVQSLIDYPDFKFTMANPDYSEHTDYHFVHELTKQAQVDPVIQPNHENVGVPNGYQSPDFMYNQSCLEVSQETFADHLTSYLTEKTWRGLMDGMPCMGNEYQEVNLKSLGFKSYTEMTDNKSQVEASKEFCERIKSDPDFYQSTLSIIDFNKNLAHEYLDMQRYALPEGEEHTIFYEKTSVIFPQICTWKPGTVVYRTKHDQESERL